MSNKNLFLMFTAGFLAMFLTMYVMVDKFDHVLISINKVYMAALMAAAMGITHTLTMPSMFKDIQKRNLILFMSVVCVLILTAIIRKQVAVNNQQFLKSMITHHSSAILMCEEANITSNEISELCNKIIKTQNEEITIMQELLER